MKAEQNKYLDNVLISLKRQYSKDEYVAALLKKIKDLEYNNGVLVSEKDETIYLLEKEVRKLNSRIEQILSLNPTEKLNSKWNSKIERVRKMLRDTKRELYATKKENERLERINIRLLVEKNSC